MASFLRRIGTSLRRKPKPASSDPGLGFPKGQTLDDRKRFKKQVRNAVIAETRAKVWLRDENCRFCDGVRMELGHGCHYSNDEMHEIVSRAQLRGCPPEQIFNTANCVRLCRACHRDVTANRITIDEFTIPGNQTGADGRLVFGYNVALTPERRAHLMAMPIAQLRGVLTSEIRAAALSGDFKDAEAVASILELRRRTDALSPPPLPTPPQQPPHVPPLLHPTHYMTSMPSSVFASTTPYYPNGLDPSAFHGPAQHIMLVDERGIQMERRIGNTDPAEFKLQTTQAVIWFDRTDDFEETDRGRLRIYRERVETPTTESSGKRGIIVEPGE